jgi:hypothetical protein
VLFGFGGWKLGDLSVSQEERNFLLAKGEGRTFELATVKLEADEGLGGERGGGEESE